MTKYIIRWNAGYGDDYEEVDADSEEEAEKMAYEAWREEAENNADYGVEVWSKALAEDYGL